MPITTELLGVLMSKGISGADLLEVTAAIEAADAYVRPVEIPVDTTAERRRAWDRERKARQRHSGGHSTGLPPDTQCAPLSIELEPTKEEKKPKREARGSRIPPDWKPSQELIAKGARLGFTAVQFDREVEKFRNHWLAKSGRDAIKLDWDRTFDNWLLRGSERLPGNARPVPVAAPVTTAEAVWVKRGTRAWDAWVAHRGRAPVSSFRDGEEGQFFRSEFPPIAEAAE